MYVCSVALQVNSLIRKQENDLPGSRENFALWTVFGAIFTAGGGFWLKQHGGLRDAIAIYATPYSTLGCGSEAHYITPPAMRFYLYLICLLLSDLNCIISWMGDWT